MENDNWKIYSLSLFLLVACIGKDKSKCYSNGNVNSNIDRIVTRHIIWKKAYAGTMISDSIFVIMPCIFKSKGDTICKIVCYENGLNDPIAFKIGNTGNTALKDNFTIVKSDTQFYDRDFDSIKISGSHGNINAEISDYALINLVLRPSSDLNRSNIVDQVSCINGSLKGEYNTLNLCRALLQNLNSEKISKRNTVNITYTIHYNGVKKSIIIPKSKIDVHNFINIINYFIYENILY